MEAYQIMPVSYWFDPVHLIICKGANKQAVDSFIA
jgi:hypothetical protein